MVALSRLPTRDRLNAWGINVPLHCVLCSEGLESHQHLFFQCSFVAGLWAHYCGNYGLSVPSSLNAVSSLLSLRQVGDTPGLRVVLKLLLQAIVYCSWRERNLRIFQQTSSTEAGVKAQVHRLLRDLLVSTQPPTPASTLLQVYLSLLPSGL
ncbi:hypothetical protein Bca4012_002833 [Brassica carinata]|uniref:Reverse transcriptase zinc-binding domain-containing protein n=1 Tax=Brassica carinata TaxID=52824 RepID=A0A8X7RXC8_BRACI|nr:hypothetical protein Bca52824_042416 [Brassica carinata]